jgi:3'-phosphoadenosine 5'-phosphosulfate sulfotransferase (PAPS reductase)/FAD synthetase
MSDQKKKLFISFSGGRTSGFMTWWLIKNYGDQFDIKVVFANTGSEREETLQFVDQCDKHFGWSVVWVEAVVHHNERKSSTHKVVSFETASRKGEPFEEVIKEYGIPNMAWPHCTRELKTNAMGSFIKSLGWKKWTTAIGIRADEIDRINPKFRKLRFWYPLVGLSITKQDVKRWWLQQSFDLNLQEHQGNCAWCWKKSFRKHMTLIHESPEIYDFPRQMEKKYGMAERNPESEDRVFFRQNMSTDDLFELAKQPFRPFVESDDWKQERLFEMDAPNGCDDSCEAFGPDFTEWEALQ